ncbi:MAG: hypothetical protein ACKODB_13505 [Betaproteobacteria bacterium]
MPQPARLLAPLAIACSVALLAGCGPSKSELAREIAALKEQVEKGTGESRSLSDQLNSAKGDLEAARRQLAEARAQAGAVDKQLSEAKSAGEVERKAADEVKAELEKVRVTIMQHERQVDERGAEIRALQQQLDAARAAERGAAAERDGLSAQVAELRQRVTAADTKLQQSGANLEQEQKRASDLTDRLAVVVREQSSMRQVSEAQRAELASISAALADAQAVVARLTGARGIYTVQDGDSLSSISLYFYRNAFRWPGIAKANSHLINHPDRIFPAMVLIIPK